MAKHNWMGVEIELSGGSLLITDFNKSKQDLWVLEETGGSGGSQGGASIAVTAGTVHIMHPGYSITLVVGESAVFGSGRWRRANVFAPAVKLLPYRKGQVEFVACANVIKWLQFQPQPNPFILVMDDIGCPDRGFIRNTTPVASYTEIVIALGSNKLHLVNGEAAEKVAGQWVRHSKGVSAPAVPATATWTPVSFGSVGMKTAGAAAKLQERHPISDGRAKKCTCGCASVGGRCSDWCDLVRTDD